MKTWAAAREDDGDISETEVREALIEFDALWDELFPAEQARIVQLLVERVDVDVDGISIRLRTEGIASVIADLGSGRTCRGQHDAEATRSAATDQAHRPHPDRHQEARLSQAGRFAGRRQPWAPHGRASTTRCSEPSSRRSTGSSLSQASSGRSANSPRPRS